MNTIVIMTTTIVITMEALHNPKGVLQAKAYQHGGSQIKLAEELCDEDVYFHQPLAVCLLNLSDQVSEPLILVLGTGHPDEVKLGEEGDQKDQSLE